MLPRGTELFVDIKRALPDLPVSVVLDVGANVGQSAREIIAVFPEASIHCFEPATETFERLKKNLRGWKRVHFHRVALGAAHGTGMLRIDGPSTMFSLIGAEQSVRSTSEKHENVQIETLDRFCSEHRIRHVSYLKIDAEGGDLDVLAGAQQLLDEQRVDLVQVEAGMHPRNTGHVSFEALKSFLEARRYYLFGIYKQAQEWPTQEVNLRRANCVFISASLIAKTKGGL